MIPPYTKIQKEATERAIQKAGIHWERLSFEYQKELIANEIYKIFEEKIGKIRTVITRHGRKQYFERNQLSDVNNVE
jgi:ribosomal protein L23